MYQNKITLMPRDILEKEFKIDTRGYRLKEVDQFLDIVIGDYEQFFEIISNLEKEKADLLAEIMNLKQELRNSKLSVEVASNSSSNGEVTNVDVIRRLSQLEKMVYGNKQNVAVETTPEEVPEDSEEEEENN
jgi:DivIVA domain-containing protein